MLINNGATWIHTFNSWLPFVSTLCWLFTFKSCLHQLSRNLSRLKAMFTPSISVDAFRSLQNPSGGLYYVDPPLNPLDFWHWSWMAKLKSMYTTQKSWFLICPLDKQTWIPPKFKQRTCNSFLSFLPSAQDLKWRSCTGLSADGSRIRVLIKQHDDLWIRIIQRFYCRSARELIPALFPIAPNIARPSMVHLLFVSGEQLECTKVTLLW